MGKNKAIIKNKQHSTHGFTLVELAIVMTIIGLLIAGILKGQQLIENARVTATVSQIKAYEAALTTFRDTYGALPGDILNANEKIPGCSDTSNAGEDCDSDGALADGAIGDRTQANVANDTENTENTLFWTHLQLSNLISGVAVTPATRGTGTSQVFYGEALPTLPLGGGARASSSDGASPNSNQVAAGIVNVIWTAFASADVGDNTTSAGLLTTRLSERIDLKMDDGRPNTGSVTSHGIATVCGGINYGADGVPGGAGANADTVISDIYTVSAPGLDCGLVFNLL